MCSVLGVVAVVAVGVVMGRGKHPLLGVVVAHVCEHAVLDVAAQKALLAHGASELLRVDSPAHVSSKEQGLLGLKSHLLVQVVLE